MDAEEMGVEEREEEQGEGEEVEGCFEVYFCVKDVVLYRA